MLVFAHRGYHRACHENTLAAFEAAVALGVDGIETDVRLSADGVPVLFHDRLLPDGRPVASLSAGELSAAVGYAVPTLADALSMGAGVLWNVEIKATAAAEPAARLLAAFPHKDRLIVTSFHHPVVGFVAERAGIRGGLLIAHRPADFGGLLAPGADTLVWNFETADAGCVKEAKARGLQSHVYGAVTRDEHARAAAWRPAAIITDDPDYAEGR